MTINTIVTRAIAASSDKKAHALAETCDVRTPHEAVLRLPSHEVHTLSQYLLATQWRASATPLDRPVCYDVDVPAWTAHLLNDYVTTLFVTHLGLPAENTLPMEDFITFFDRVLVSVHQGSVFQTRRNGISCFTYSHYHELAAWYVLVRNYVDKARANHDNHTPFERNERSRLLSMLTQCKQNVAQFILVQQLREREQTQRNSTYDVELDRAMAMIAYGMTSWIGLTG